MATYVIEARFDLRSRFHAVMASKATKKAVTVRGNMHMDTRIIEVADLKSIRGHLKAVFVIDIGLREHLIYILWRTGNIP